MRRTHFFVVAVMVLAPGPASAQGVLRGLVRDSSGRPLDAVEVVLDEGRWRARTDSGGRYSINAEPGTRTVVFRHIGYGPVTNRVQLVRGQVLVLNATLAVGDMPQLDTVVVRAPRPRGVGREAFDERRALGLGTFIDSTLLRKAEGRRLSEVLREYGVGMASKDIHGRRYYAVHRLKGCFMTIYLDGVAVYRSGARGQDPPDLAHEFAVAMLDAVEVYRSLAELPMEFAGRGSDCGVIVLWTKRGK